MLSQVRVKPPFLLDQKKKKKLFLLLVILFCFLYSLLKYQSLYQTFLKITLPEHFGMSQTAIDVGVHRGSHSARLSSCWTLLASIHDPIVTSSLLNILKLKARNASTKKKGNQKRTISEKGTWKWITHKKIYKNDRPVISSSCQWRNHLCRQNIYGAISMLKVFTSKQMSWFLVPDILNYLNHWPKKKKKKKKTTQNLNAYFLNNAHTPE